MPNPLQIASNVPTDGRELRFKIVAIVFSDAFSYVKLIWTKFILNICNGFGRNPVRTVSINYIDIASCFFVFSFRVWNVDWISKATAFNIIPAVIGVWIITLPADDIFQFGNQFTYIFVPWFVCWCPAFLHWWNILHNRKSWFHLDLIFEKYKRKPLLNFVYTFCFFRRIFDGFPVSKKL